MSLGFSVAMDTRVLIQSASNHFAAFPHPYLIKTGQLASDIFKFQSENFCHLRASNSKVSSLIRPEIKLVRTFKPVLVKSNFYDDLIKHEQASMETAFSNYKSMGNFLDAQGQLTPWSEVRSGRNSNSSKILCMSSLPASIKRIGSKSTDKRWRHRFPNYKSMGAFCCHGNQSFDPICPKPYAAFFPPQWCYI